MTAPARALATPAALAAGLLVALLAALGLAAAAPATALGEGAAAAPHAGASVAGEADEAFRGELLSASVGRRGGSDAERRVTYVVKVTEVFGESTLTSRAARRVEVAGGPGFVSCVGRPTVTDIRAGRTDYVFVVSTVDDRRQLDGCDDVVAVTDEGDLTDLEGQFGPLHRPGTPVPRTTEPAALPDVTFTCDGEDRVVSDVEQAGELCGQTTTTSLQRAAAPGAALVLVGLLGLVLVRRLGTRR